MYIRSILLTAQYNFQNHTIFSVIDLANLGTTRKSGRIGVIRKIVPKYVEKNIRKTKPNPLRGFHILAGISMVFY